MRTRFHIDSGRLGAAVRRFLAQGRAARLAGCLAVALAAVVWLSVAMVVLRIVFMLVLLLAAVWCAQLVAAVWWGPIDWKSTPAGVFYRVSARARLALAGRAADRSSAEEGECEVDELKEEALAAFRRSAEALTVELLSRQERLHENGERLQRELGVEIEALRALIARFAQLEQELVARPAGGPERTTPASVAIPASDLAVDLDLRAAFDELDADLRLEKIEEREQTLDERERRLDRRERELAAFVAELHSRLS